MSNVMKIEALFCDGTCSYVNPCRTEAKSKKIVIPVPHGSGRCRTCLPC